MNEIHWFGDRPMMSVLVDGVPEWRDFVITSSGELVPELNDGELLERTLDGTCLIFRYIPSRC